MTVPTTRMSVYLKTTRPGRLRSLKTEAMSRPVRFHPESGIATGPVSSDLAEAATEHPHVERHDPESVEDEEDVERAESGAQAFFPNDAGETAERE